MRILLAVDGSKPALEAAKLLVEHADWYREKPEVELVTVHLPVPKLSHMSAAVSKEQIERYYREEGEENLTAAKKLLERSGLSYNARVLVGPVAETLVKHAKSSRCDLIRPMCPSEFALLVFAPEETNLVMARLELDRFIADWAELRACLEIAAANRLDVALLLYA